MLETDFNFHPSRFFMLLTSSVILVCSLIILTVALTWWEKGLILVATYGYAWYILRQFVFLTNASAILSVKKLMNGEWQIANNQGRFAARLCGDSTVCSYVCVLKFKSNECSKFLPISTIVFPDALQHDEFRKLLVTLKCS